MNSNQRLFVTPEERARRMAEQNKYPHGGEGNCGGMEGHGAPELLRKRAEEQEKRNAGNVGKSQGATRAPQKNAPSDPAPKESVSANKQSGKASVAAGVFSREQLVSAMKLSFALGEPACRRYGMSSPFHRNGAK